MRKQRRGGETNGWKAAAESEEGKRTDGSPLLVGGTAGRRNLRLNSLRVKHESRLDLPTPESPIRMRRRTCVRPCGEGTSRRHPSLVAPSGGCGCAAAAPGWMRMRAEGWGLNDSTLIYLGFLGGLLVG